MSYYNFHVFVCQNARADGHPRGCCQSRGSEAVFQHLKSRIRELGLNKEIRINKSGCLDRCEEGPVLVIYPEETWYSVDSVDKAEELLQSHLLNKQKITNYSLSNQREF